MREIKYKGIDIKTNKMIYGSLIQNNDASFIVEREDYSDIGYCYNCDRSYSNQHQVDPDTVSEYTGLNDINENEIYEGDIVIYKNNKFKIKYEIGNFMLVRISQETDMYELFKDCWNDDVYPLSQFSWNYGEPIDLQLSGLEIIDNIYENSELLSK